jgi:hypothetical protein
MSFLSNCTRLKAGLFSAVDSAFIIQIQPEIQAPGTPTMTVVAQSLLYISLGSTLLAALLAVLGMQWLMYYSTAGNKGTIEARGLECQKKLDGLHKWKFDMVMQTFPLLLQFALLIFAVALTVYLWRIKRAHAIIALCFTSIGFVSYTAFLISAAIASDSPFQTPLAALVTRLNPKTLWKTLVTFCHLQFQHLHTAWSAFMHRSRNVLPLFVQDYFQWDSIKQDKQTPLFDGQFPDLSPEVPAVSWVLETSTDPLTIITAAEMVITCSGRTAQISAHSSTGCVIASWHALITGRVVIGHTTCGKSWRE